MSLLQNSNAISAGGYDVNNSLRFRSSATAYLNRTPSVTSNLTTWTWSGWVKLGALSTDRTLFGAASSGNAQLANIHIAAANSFEIDILDANSTRTIRGTTAVYRDPSAWYHVVFILDTTQATAANRMRLYINGNQISLDVAIVGTYPAQNANCIVNSTSGVHNVARRPQSNDRYFDGYMAEVNFIDGSAKTPSDFGETDTTTGVWKPKAYTGTYGTNGFYLPFKNNTASTYAGTFNGSTQSLSVASNAVFGYGTSDFTMEGWFYFNSLSTMTLMSNLTAGSSVAPHIYYESASGLYYYTGSTNRITGGVLQANNWYHIAVSRSGTSTKMFVNGIQVGSTYTDTNNYGTSNPFIIADYAVPVSGVSQFNGNISNVRVVKGTALYTSNFVPSSVSLTAITNTSILTLQSATIVDNSSNSLTITNNGTLTTSTATPFVANIFGDNSGNNNNWTGNNINYSVSGTTYDAMIDSPTNTSATVANYAVVNPINNSASGNITFSQANLALSLGVSGQWRTATATMSMPSGKWYWEVTKTNSTTSNDAMIGIIADTVNISGAYYPSQGALGYTYLDGGQKGNAAGGSAYGATWGINDVIGIAFDADTRQLTFYKNGTSQGLAFTVTSGHSYYPAFGGATTVPSYAINFGQRPFNYSAPSGFLPLNTFNLPTPTILQGNKYMDATLWTGDNANPRAITNTAGFQPDLVWIKARNSAQQHVLNDSVRGTGTSKGLSSNTTDAEGSANILLYGATTAFNSNGFSVGGGTSNQAFVNFSTFTYVGWQWQAGQGSTSSNTSGSITTTTSVNATAGFSIVNWTANNSTATIGHGLGVAPKMIITKDRNDASNWDVYHVSLGATKYLQLNTTIAAGTSSTRWNNTEPTSTVFSVSTDVNYLTHSIIAYCWAEIAGFSKFGSYTGNGSADGPFVATNFLPKFLMVKRTDTTGNWRLIDTARYTSNTMGNELYPNSSAAEAYNAFYDVLSNGFKMRNTNTDLNASGGTYIYACFSSNPFKNSTAV